jgi:xylulokinase
MSLLGIDLGTTGCKSAVFSEDGECLVLAYREYPTARTAEGFAELDSGAVWENVRESVREAVARNGADPVTALSVSSFGEALTPVTRDRRILGNAILCSDPRGGEYVEALERDFGQERFYRINPNTLGPQYSLPKLLWLREHEPGLFEQADYFLAGADLAAFLLGAEPRTSNSLANRTLLFDLDRNAWSEELLAWSGIPGDKLAPIVPGGTVTGTVSEAAARDLGLPANVTIVAGAHDQCCNALGCGCVEAGSVVCGIGTFECITPVYRKVAEPAAMLRLGLNIEHHVLPDLFVSFLFNQAGSLVKWFRDTFAADAPRDGTDLYAALNREMPVAPTDLLVLPHFEPPMFPRYIPDTAGAIVGLRTSTTRGEILKAIMECETLYFVDSIRALSELGIDAREFVATGGGAKSDAWLQIKADVFGVPFIRPRFSESSVAGAAMNAGLGSGVFADAVEATRRFVHRERAFEPDARRHASYADKAEQYRALFPALRAVLGRLSR